MNEPQTPREFCAALTAERIDADPAGDPYAEGVLSDGRAWSLFGAKEGSACTPDEPMAGLLWLEFTSAEDEGTRPARLPGELHPGAGDGRNQARRHGRLLTADPLRHELGHRATAPRPGRTAMT